MTRGKSKATLPVTLALYLPLVCDVHHRCIYHRHIIQWQLLFVVNAGGTHMYSVLFADWYKLTLSNLLLGSPSFTELTL